jgi:hypothetical protein
MLWLWVALLCGISILVGTAWGVATSNGAQAAITSISADAWSAIAALLSALAAFLLLGIAVLQSNTSRKQLRAYVAAKPEGIVTTSDGRYVAHVIFENVGHMPAYNFAWQLQKITVSGDGDWTPPDTREPQETNNVLPVGIEAKRGSAGITHEQIENCKSDPKWLYVWGRLAYTDGFGSKRFTKFCQRYNWVNRRPCDGGGWRIPADSGRHHESGNEAN